MTEASLGWLPLFGANARRTLPGQGPGQRLTTLACLAHVSLDAAFVSPIMLFRGLAHLALRPPCFSPGGCTFRLTDKDIADIAMALPKLEEALFGHVCPVNSCLTTVSSLLFLSARCKNLTWLEIHFNTTNLRRDLESMVENPRLRDLCALPKCPLGQLIVSQAPFLIEEGDYEPVLAGFRCIFPSLGGVAGMVEGWFNLTSMMWGME